MNIDDKIFWLIMTVPILPCCISFVLGGVIGSLTMSFLNDITEYKDPYSTWENVEKEVEEDGTKHI